MTTGLQVIYIALGPATVFALAPERNALLINTDALSERWLDEDNHRVMVGDLTKMIKPKQQHDHGAA